MDLSTSNYMLLPKRAFRIYHFRLFSNTLLCSYPLFGHRKLSPIHVYMHFIYLFFCFRMEEFSDIPLLRTDSNIRLYFTRFSLSASCMKAKKRVLP